MRKKLPLYMITALSLSLAACTTGTPSASGNTAASAESSIDATDDAAQGQTDNANTDQKKTDAAESDRSDSTVAADKENNADTDAKSSSDETSFLDSMTASAAALKAQLLKTAGQGDSYTAGEDNSHAVAADDGTLMLSGISVEKTGGVEGDEADFYGTNAAVYAENGVEVDITDAYIHTAGAHANAVFSYGEDTVLNISDSLIETEENNSGGIMVTGGGTLHADNLYVSTLGGSSAAIRSDRGGGTLTVNGGYYESYGSGSPAIYSTADITVNNADLYSDISQAVVVEGKNSVTLNNTNAVGQNTRQNSDKTNRQQAVMIYQSMSGDAAEGKGSFTMNGGSLTSLYEGMFYVTNTVAEINLNNVELYYATDALLRIEAAGWGNEGSNGGQVKLTAKDQALEGVITVDEYSNLNLLLNGNSVFEGSIDNSGEVYIELNDNAKWVLTADSAIDSLTCSENAIDLNGHTLTVAGEEYAAGTASTGTAIEVKVTESSHGAPDGMPPEKPADANGDRPERPDGMGGGNPPERPQ